MTFPQFRTAHKLWKQAHPKPSTGAVRLRVGSYARDLRPRRSLSGPSVTSLIFSWRFRCFVLGRSRRNQKLVPTSLLFLDGVLLFQSRQPQKAAGQLESAVAAGYHGGNRVPPPLPHAHPRRPRYAQATVAAHRSDNHRGARSAGRRLTAAGRPGDKTGLQAVLQGSAISMFDGNRPVFRYRYADVPMKPYADQLISPAGVQVLRDSPFDHKHHHGLMYVVKVDGVDFWAEFNAQYGKQHGRTLNVTGATRLGDVERAGFVQELNWIGPASPKPLMVEHRAIVDVFKAADLARRWSSGAPACRRRPAKIPSWLPAITISAWACGFSSRWIAAAISSTPTTRPADFIQRRQRFTPTRWCAYTAKAEGRSVTVALFDHPANLRHPAHMFTMNTPFAYMSATMNVWKEPITVAAGHPLNLCYGVALWDGEADKATDGGNLPAVGETERATEKN